MRARVHCRVRSSENRYRYDRERKVFTGAWATLRAVHCVTSRASLTRHHYASRAIRGRAISAALGDAWEISAGSAGHFRHAVTSQPWSGRPTVHGPSLAAMSHARCRPAPNTVAEQQASKPPARPLARATGRTRGNKFRGGKLCSPAPVDWTGAIAWHCAGLRPPAQGQRRHRTVPHAKQQCNRCGRSPMSRTCRRRVFRPIVNADFGRTRTRIPTDGGHRFRSS